MPGFSPKLPLEIDPVDGFGLTKSLKQVINQNLKMLLLTNPGEKINDARFGVGIKTFLFQPNVPYTYAEIEQTTRRQVLLYMPHIKINKMIFGPPESSTGVEENELNIKIEYFVKPLGINDIISLTLLNAGIEEDPSGFGDNDLIT